ncbi:MAG: DUF6498-containing protein [Pseudomonadota bacterium]
MLNWLNPDELIRIYRDPIALAILLVDLFPLFAVLSLGWGAPALVFLYWLENLVIGVVALARMTAASMSEHPIGAIGMLLTGPFFIVHYGLFCFVHGVFVFSFATGLNADIGFPDPFGLITAALGSGAHMEVFLGAIILLQIILFVTDYLINGAYKRAEVQKEMMAPYGRIMILHVGLFAGMAALIAFGQPLWGVLALIGLRMLWGVFQVRQRAIARDAETKVDGPSPI